jgi:hypothetical protein
MFPLTLHRLRRIRISLTARILAERVGTGTRQESVSRDVTSRTIDMNTIAGPQ